MRFTGIRLLLVFVATNTIMILMLVTSMTSKHPWLAHVLPGQFQSGGDYSGYWVFFSLVLLVDAITVMGAALLLLVPALRWMTSVNIAYMADKLANRAGVAESARTAMFEAMRDELAAARQQLFVGRSILIGGALFLVVAFGSLTLSFARAIPDGRMFVVECIEGRVICEPWMRSRAVINGDVTGHQVELFTGDQILRAVLFGAPDVYDWHLGTLASNPDNVGFSNFVFVFRLLTFLVLILTLGSLRFPAVEAGELAENVPQKPDMAA